jgi:hypothetical protein
MIKAYEDVLERSRQSHLVASGGKDVKKMEAPRKAHVQPLNPFREEVARDVLTLAKRARLRQGRGQGCAFSSM